ERKFLTIRAMILCPLGNRAGRRRQGTAPAFSLAIAYPVASCIFSFGSRGGCSSASWNQGMGQGTLSFSKKTQTRMKLFDWRSEMNIKSLLIGSAAALAVVSGAQAADAIVAAEPEPMEYVRVCDAFGTGFFYIPGTETCLKIGGYVRAQVDIFEVGDETAIDMWTRGRLEISAQSDSELGA